MTEVNYLAALDEHNASVTLERNFIKSGPEFNDFDSIMCCVSRHTSVTQLLYSNYEYRIGCANAIEVAPGIKFELLETKIDEKTQLLISMKIKLSSRTKNLADIKEYISDCINKYHDIKNDKLGNTLYYFDQTTVDDKAFKKNVFVFTKQPFITNRKFGNIFFEQKDELVDRIKHFMNNKAWYEERGIPHTFGVGMFGYSGCGKTSTQKAIAKETHRHIINFKINEQTSESQLKSLFYDPILYIKNPDSGSIESIIVPMNQRFYTLEDADAMGDILTSREVTIVQKSKTDTVNEPTVDDEDGFDSDLAEFMRKEMKKESEEEEKEDELLKKNDKITLASLLNLLDGILERDDNIMAIASQYFDLFDPALVRPGRIDMIIHFQKTNRIIIKQLVDSFYGTNLPPEHFAEIEEYKITHARVNQICFQRMNKDPKEAIAALIIESKLPEQPKKILKKLL